MSLYVAWINRIKEGAEETWLTPHQRVAYEAILSQWRTQPFVNLHGPEGCGKSFIGRMLAKKHGFVYAQALSEVYDGAGQIVIDDAEYDRSWRTERRLRGMGRVILLTRRPVSDAMPKPELTLDARDIAHFQRYLSERCGITFTQTMPDGDNLAEILRQEAVARGSAHVYQRS